MHPIFTKITMPFVYGPLTQEEADSIVVSKVQITESDGIFAGTAVEQTNLSQKKIFKWVPPVIEE